jgi:hypothetical protein
MRAIERETRTMTEQAALRPLTTHLRAEERYRDDPTYHAMVDMLTSVIARLEMTPSEVRECAVYACIRYEHLNMQATRRYMRDGVLLPNAERDMREELDRCEERARGLRKWLDMVTEEQR